jgi:uncharacterized DUF497 family protein
MNNVFYFEWDTNKAAANQLKHGVSFSEAIKVFRDPFAIEKLDDRESYGEERFIIIGMIENRLFVVVYTERGQNIRVVSAREAEKYERQYYYSQNAQGWNDG